MKFKDSYFSKAHKYCLGIEELSQKRYISIPVSNSKIDYQEYYEIDAQEFEALMNAPEKAIQLAEKCRRRENDANLILKPGSERGFPF